VAFLASETRDVAAAEDALSEAFAAALKHWDKLGTPKNPRGWLIGVARRRLIDRARHNIVRSAHAEETRELAVIDDMDRPDLPDRRLALMFVCAHPAIAPAIRAPLMLQTLLGLPVDRIAAAFLVQPATMAQRLVRAKAKMKSATIRFAMPSPGELADRLPAVLDAIYAAYGIGWADAADGADIRSGHSAEAMFLGQLVAAQLENEPEALGLVALMSHAEARRAARAPNDTYVPFDEQDPASWDAALIATAEQALARASRLGKIGRYQLEAAIQSALAQKQRGRPVDWAAVARISDALVSLTRSPVAITNHAAALLKIDDFASAGTALDIAAADPRMATYQPYWATRAEFCRRNGDAVGQRAAMVHAIALCRDPAVGAWLEQRR
jgi:RNA polymerase sigma-70 factor, ECF subfamily